MKRTLLILLFVSVYFISNAQTTGFGIKAGLNLSNQSRSNYPVNLKSDYLTGFHLGGFIDIGYKKLSIQPGLFFETRGEKITAFVPDPNTVGHFATAKSKTTLDYIEVPINFLYKTSLSRSADVHLGGGPYFGYGISADNNTNGKSYPVVFNKNTVNAINYKNPDYGVNFIAGFTVQRKFIVDAGYSLGLANLYYDATTKLHNRAFSLSVGYLFK